MKKTPAKKSNPERSSPRPSKKKIAAPRGKLRSKTSQTKLAKAATTPASQQRPTPRSGKVQPASTSSGDTLKAPPGSAVSKISPRPIPPPTLPSPSVRETPTKSRTRKPPIVPPILMEGDVDPIPLASGPGERYALGPSPGAPAVVSREPLRDLPEAYGTGRLFLTARDPHWLYAAWDLTAEQRKSYAALARDGQLTIRTHLHQIGSQPATETQVGPEAKSWFINVREAGTRHLAELGYYDRRQIWTPLAISLPTLTPPESMSEQAGVEFATIPASVSLQKLFEAVQELVTEIIPVSEAIQEIRSAPNSTLLPELVVTSALTPTPAPMPTAMRSSPSIPAQATEDEPTAAFEGLPRQGPPPEPFVPSVPSNDQPLISAVHQGSLIPLPAPAQPIANQQPGKKLGNSQNIFRTTPPKWTPAQAQALANVIRLDSERRVWMGSLEITELVRRHLQQEISSGALAGQEGGEAGFPGAGPTDVALGGAGISSPLAAPEQGGRDQRFWLSVNAELVLYGATAADAKVSAGGRPIRLRPDGTFSYRFALPDGQYPLKISAEAADGHDRRSVQLQFGRSTQLSGEVRAHPQATDLQAPEERHLT